MSSQKLTQSPLTYSVASLASDKILRYNDKYSPLPRHVRSSLQFTPSPSKQHKEQQLAAELESSQATCSVLRARVAALKQQLTVKTSHAAALADKVSSLTLQLDRVTKTQTARVQHTPAYQTLKGEATAAAKQSAGLEAALKAAQQQLEDSNQAIAELQESLHQERSAHQLTAQREEQAAAALAAEHQRHGSSSSALTSAHQQLQAKQAETELLLAQLCDADSTVVQLQETVADLTQRLQGRFTAAVYAAMLAASERWISAQLAKYCNSLAQQLEECHSLKQQQEAAATQAASTIKDLQEAATKMEIEHASLQASLAVEQSLHASTASALLAAQQGLAASSAAAQPMADMASAAQIDPPKQQPAQPSRKAPRSKPARTQPYASTGSYAMLQQQLANSEALLQKQADAAAAAATRASSAEWRVGKLSAECSHLQQQHAADVSAISTLQQQVQQLQSQLLLLQQEPVQALQQQYQEEQQQEQGRLQAPLEAKQGAKDSASLHSLPGDTTPLTDTLQGSTAATQHSRPQYVPPPQYAQAYLGWATGTAGQLAAFAGAADQAAPVLHPSSTVNKDACVLFPRLDTVDVAAGSESLAAVRLTRQWGSGLCEARCSESDDGSSRRSSSSIGDTTAAPDTISHTSQNSSGGDSSGSNTGDCSEKQGGEDGAVLASSGSLQDGEDAKDSFYTALEALSEEGDE